MKALIIPDTHFCAEKDNRRADWIGNAILEIDPDIVIHTGDFNDLSSLSSYDKGKRSAELRRYRNDVLAGIDALQRINAPLEKYNDQKKNIRKAQRKIPRKVLTLGNHESRILRAVETSPELLETLKIEDLEFEKHGWEVIPYREPIEIEGIWCCHNYVSGVRGEAVSGLNIAASLLAKNMTSSLVGHQHVLDWAIRSKPNGEKLMALCAGCFVEESTWDAAPDSLWWSGLCVLHNLKDGCYDLETLNLERIKELYS